MNIFELVAGDKLNKTKRIFSMLICCVEFHQEGNILKMLLTSHIRASVRRINNSIISHNKQIKDVGINWKGGGIVAVLSSQEG